MQILPAVGVLFVYFVCLISPAHAQRPDPLCEKYRSALQSGVTPIIQDLRAGAWQVRSNAARCLAYRGSEKEIIDSLKLAATDEDVRVRRSALSALGKLGKASSVILDALQDKSPLVRFVAAKYAWQGDAAAAVPLVYRVADRQEDFIVRVRAAESLERLGSKGAQAVQTLIPLLDEKDLSLRSAIVRALGGVGTGARPALPKLRAMLQKSEKGTELNGWIREAIVRIG